MNFRASYAFVAIPIALLAGCVCKPVQPLPPKESGVAFFIVSGPDESLSIFRSKFSDVAPHDCAQVAYDERHTKSAEGSILYQCKKTDEQTFAAFGTLFTVVSRGMARNAQASLEPLYAQAGDNAIRVTATTTACDNSYCSKLNSYGPWMPNKVCLQFCQ